MRGHWSSLVTPVTEDDEIDVDGLRSNIEKVIRLGTRGIGFTWPGGEFWSLTVSERKKICETAVEAAKGRVLIGLHTTSNSLRDCIELTRHAEAAGADLVILGPPYVAKNDEQVYRFVERVAEKVDIPIGFLNSPHMGMLMTAQGVAKLSTIPNFCVIKEASYPVNPSLTLEINRLCGHKIVVSSPYDEIFFSEQFTDFHQQVMFANPQDWMFDTPEHNYYVQFINLATDGRSVEAARLFKEKCFELRKIYDRHWHLMLKKHNGAFPSQAFKAWANLVDLATGQVRAPIMPMTEAEVVALRDDLIKAGRLKPESSEVLIRT